MDEFKEFLMNTYIEFVYEGQEVANFYDNIKFDDLNYEKKYDLLINHCLEHIVINYMKISHTLTHLNHELRIVDKLNRLKNSKEIFMFLDLMKANGNKYNIGYNNFDEFEYIKEAFLYHYNELYLNSKIFEEYKRSFDFSSSYRYHLEIFREILYFFRIDYRNIMI